MGRFLSHHTAPRQRLRPQTQRRAGGGLRGGEAASRGAQVAPAMAPMSAACMTYAGIGPRTSALLVDALVFAPVLAIFIILFDRLQTVPAMLVYMGYGALGGAYDIYFLTRWG